MAALLRVAAEVSTSSAGGLFASLLRTQGARSFHGGAAICAKAKDKASAGGGGGGGGGGHGEGGMSSTHCTGLNYKKGGSDPELGPDEAYPDWLWKLAEPKKTLTELEKEVAAAKLTGRYDVMDVKDVKRLLKLRRRAKIKANNASRESDVAKRRETRANTSSPRFPSSPHRVSLARHPLSAPSLGTGVDTLSLTPRLARR